MEVKVERKKHVGVVSEKDNGWKKELNIVEWNNQPAKYDIREWAPDHERMSKGITLTEAEARALYTLLKGEFEDA